MDATLTIKAGAGGQESEDFAMILTIMYVKWAHRHGVTKTEVSSFISKKEHKIIMFGIEPGKLAGEHGIHRLCRIAPSDSQKRRHTSFARVEVSGIEGFLHEGPIRNYTLDPYQQAEDRRKRYTTASVQDVLDGGEELDKMMNAPVGMFDIPGAEGATIERRTLTQAEMDYALTLTRTIEK